MTPADDLHVTAEAERIAMLVHLEPAELSYLHDLDLPTLHSIRDAVIARLYDENADGMGRIAAAAMLVPPQLSAAIAQRAFTPKLCARLAAHLDPKRAVEISKRLPPEFLAEVALEIDPRRAEKILARFPSKVVVKVSRILFPRREYVAMGRFVDLISDKAVAAVLADATDYVGLLHISMYVENLDRIDLVVRSMDDEQVTAIMRAALEERELWPLGLSLIEEVSPEQRARLADSLVPLMLDQVDRDPDAGWAEAVDAYEMAGRSTRDAIIETARTLDPELKERAVATATEMGLMKRLDGLGDALSS